VKTLFANILKLIDDHFMDDRDYYFSSTPGRTIVGSRFVSGDRAMRIASQVQEGEPGYRFITVNDELVIKTTPKKRQQIKATFLEDDRAIKSITIQRYHPETGPYEREHFTFTGNQIDSLIKFLVGIATMNLDHPGKSKLSPSDLKQLLLNQSSANQLFADNEELFVQAAQNANLKNDVIALGYRRSQLDRFERLLESPELFQSEIEKLGVRPEQFWQDFFEANTWIFGYGLSYQFTSSLSEQKLQQVVGGHSVTGKGKIVDGLLKTQAHIKSLCFVEIKRHDSALLGSEYRGGVYPPSKHLSGGVAQIQATVHSAMENIGRRLEPRSNDGSPTGEELFRAFFDHSGSYPHELK